MVQSDSSLSPLIYFSPSYYVQKKICHDKDKRSHEMTDLKDKDTSTCGIN